MSANDYTIIERREPTQSNESCPLPKGTLLEGFEIQEVIGVGGFGIVYRAHDTLLERSVALKEYFPGTLVTRLANGELRLKNPDDQDMFDTGKRSFVNEARLLAQFDHPGLVKVFRFWESAHTAYMVMPMYEGPTLKSLRDGQTNAFDQEMVLNWLLTLTDALQTMHDRQCVHRDISPENILVQSGNQQPVLLDFGAARQAIGQAAQPFTVILKASYAPIEQYSETPGLSQGPWTDVYALGAVAYFLITGKKPPTSVSRMVNDQYKPLAGQTALPYPASVLNAVDHALKLLPADRTQTMIDFRRALEESTPVAAHRKPTAEGVPDVLDLFEGDLEAQGPMANAALQPPPPPLKRQIPTPSIRTMGLLATMLLMAVIPALMWLSDSNVAQEVDPVQEQPPEPGTTTISNPQERLKPTEDANPKRREYTDVAPVFHSTLDQKDHSLNIELTRPTLQVGKDLLDFTVRSPISGEVSVFVLTSENVLLRLLPNPRVSKLTIAADIPLHLPPAHDPVLAAGPAGRNEILVTVTQQARDYSHLQFQATDGFEQIHKPLTLTGQVDNSLWGVSACQNDACADASAAGWFVVHAVD